MVLCPRKIVRAIISVSVFWPESVLARGGHSSHHVMSDGEAILWSFVALYGLIFAALSLWSDGKKIGAMGPLVIAGAPAFVLYENVNWRVVGCFATLLGILIVFSLLISKFNSLLPAISRNVGAFFNVISECTGKLMQILAFAMALLMTFVVPIVAVIVIALTIVKTVIN